MAASGSRSWPSLSPPSESSHEPPSSLSTEPRISISSTIYPSSSNNHSFDIPSYPSSPPHGRSSSMSPDRESFIDLASPTLSPRALDSQYIGIPSTTQRSLTDQPSSTSRRSGEISHVKSPVRASSTPSSQSGSTKPRLAPIIPPSTGYDKPPIPTAPKPDFSHRSRSSHRSSPVHTKKSSPMSAYPADHVDLADPVFSSSNALTPKERAERIRTTRKLAQVFGQPPGVSPVALEPGQEVEVPNGCLPVPVPLALNLNAKRRHHRPVNSLSEDVANTTPVHDAFGAIVWPPPDGTRYVSLAAHRRHSAPLSPDEFSFVTRLSSDTDRSTTSAGSSVIHIGSAQHDHASERASTASSRQSLARPAPGSPTSFIDLSDEEGAVAETPKVGRGRGQPFSPSTASLAESLTSDELAEEERRRKREKLAKLHRFLGSRVPPDLVLGPLDGTPLPPPAPSPLASFDATEDADVRKVKMRRRRSSSAAEFSRTWSDDIDRLKQGLNEREKAINVRRAIKMEKMFGVAPPQTLYHTRAPTVSTPNIVRDLHRQPSPKPAPKTPASPPFRFATSNAPKTKKSKRPGTGDSASSARPLIAHDGLLEAGSSSVYIHYRHSLNSLSDIIDRDDKESLAELHDYLTGNGELYSTGEQYDYQFDAAGSSNANNNVPSPAPATPMFGDDAPVASPSKAERRRSLPSRVSVASFSSEISALIAPTPTEASFQQRRRRAAKLTHFFGVDYRDLMNEVLESIEKGLEEERGKGTLRPDEVKDLQQKLVTLKTRRISLAH
ncbi:hypothetical protein BD310DRAFT_811559 [Dichomitus squalens]|uniref:Uncharacterized protein n=1 Tax=Dichomitus squalens TaxID=114155 RepID=A0A4Q9Q493_9APHY|nr:hypothetical protein BD310DRAFT_811559 [Dichomitus squalens]